MHRRTLIATGAAALAAACTPSLATFNRFAPHDGGARRVLRNEAYGEGTRRRLDLYAPTDPPAGAMPVVVFIYGGSWSSGAKEDYGFAGAAFASRGFLAAIPDYRIAPNVFPSFLEDCAAAVAWVQARAREHGGDPQRLVLIGHSAGAYNAIMLALDAHYLRDAGVDPRAIRGAAGLAGPYDFYPFDVESTRAAFAPARDPQATQPMHFARSDAPPLWLGWGEEDDLVGRRNIENLSAAQRRAGARVETKIYSGVSHIGIMLALSRPLRGSAPVLDDVTAFARSVAG